MKAKQPISILKLVWFSYIKSALIPIFFIEFALVSAYFFTNDVIRDQSIASAKMNAQSQLQEISKLEAANIAVELSSVARLTTLYAAQVAEAYAVNITPSEQETSRYGLSKLGAWYTLSDNGGSALFASSFTPIDDVKRNKAWQLSQLDPLMKSIIDYNPIVTQIYFNTYDSINRIYPYFNVIEQYPEDMNIPSYNFYYEADAEHNPERKTIWTDVYVDPAGQGFMASNIAPVYRQGGDFLEGVVGLDITVDKIIQQVLSLQLSWNSYALLLDKNGTIMALPEKGEGDWGLKELTNITYENAILKDTYKPADFNLFKRPDTQHIAKKLQKSPQGIVSLALKSHSKLASWSTVAGAEWKLLIITDEDNLYADALKMNAKFERIGYGMLVALLVFYILFFIYLYRKAARLSTRISTPILSLEGIITDIGNARYPSSHSLTDIKEIKHTADGLVSTGLHLQESNVALQVANSSLAILNHQLEARVQSRTKDLESSNQLLEQEKREQAVLIDKLHETQTQLVQSEKMASIGQLAAGVAHEINNPLAYISSNISCLRDYTQNLVELIDGYASLDLTDQQLALFKQLADRSDYEAIKEDLDAVFDESVSGMERIKVIVDNLRSFAHPSQNDWQITDINECIEFSLAMAGNQLNLNTRIFTDLSDIPQINCIPSQIIQVFLNLLINAGQAIDHDGEIHISTKSFNHGVSIQITDTGCGISADILNKIFDPFFTTKDIGSGTGLGLSISYGIIQAHNGQISVKNEEGKGCCFNIWLPENNISE